MAWESHDGEPAGSGDLARRERMLRSYVRSLGSVAMVFMGGVGSRVLARTCHDVLGDRMVAVSPCGGTIAAEAQESARAWCDSRGIELLLPDFDNLQVPGLADNHRNRCDLCRHALFSELQIIARARGLGYVAEPSDADEVAARPSLLRAATDLNVKSPLMHVGLGAREVRALAVRMGEDPEPPSQPICLAAQVERGVGVTPDRLARVEFARALVASLGLAGIRVDLVRGDGEVALVRAARGEAGAATAARIHADGGLRRELVRGLLGLGFGRVWLELGEGPADDAQGDGGGTEAPQA